MKQHPKVLCVAAMPFGLAAALVLVFMMLYTTWAVASRELFDSPVLGVVDVMELSLLVCVFVALPGVFLRDDNITVDVVDQIAGPKTQAVLRFFGLALTVVFLVVAFTQMEEPFFEKLEGSETSMTLEFPRFWYWLPILFGFAFSILATLWVIFHYGRHGVPPGATLSDQIADDTSDRSPVTGGS